MIVEGNKVKGLVANGQKFISDVVVSDADINLVYGKLLEAQWSPKKLLLQEKSSSAYIFYWGIKKEFSELSMQNVLLSDN